GGPYPISYGSIVPQQNEAANLLVTAAVSSSHIAYGSIRMEPVFFVLGQSAATAAAMAIDRGLAVQDIPYDALRERLEQDGQVLDYDRPVRQAAVDPKRLPGIVVDDADAQRRGAWPESTSIGGFVGVAYSHDNDDMKGEKSVVYELTVPKAGRYELRLSYTANPNRATNVPVTIETAGGEVAKTVNQRQSPAISGAWVSLGTFDFDAGKTTVTISNKATDGHVIADAVQLLPVGGK
ncbi:MAG: FAD-dependent oxidoreductase, partial [Planctomycetes bacterium]|nr:FAD-dependent oxidoreductase [Planctomycetota bacterium]